MVSVSNSRLGHDPATNSRMVLRVTVTLRLRRFLDRPEVVRQPTASGRPPATGEAIGFARGHVKLVLHECRWDSEPDTAWSDLLREGAGRQEEGDSGGREEYLHGGMSVFSLQKSYVHHRDITERCNKRGSEATHGAKRSATADYLYVGTSCGLGLLAGNSQVLNSLSVLVHEAMLHGHISSCIWFEPKAMLYAWRGFTRAVTGLLRPFRGYLNISSRSWVLFGSSTHFMPLQQNTGIAGSVTCISLRQMCESISLPTPDPRGRVQNLPTGD
ncbi:uncharacterized protein B0H18DRAFT_953822 [Fomitopsis serialis]|uniref:uncharacterized protein n=1 Tax=Fomitopsis serialis TaxID=139415 RepID=UPI0020075A5F|nr:uncharacterized protein B0H18DRAFT_953822 [Neoantrodia serialis]KAH9928928.1 hypothetical protein B0H18DRAFT_953822 [Neoantrodia serialis]